MAPGLLVPAGLVALLLSTLRVSAHGIADGITVYPKGSTSGIYYKGYNPSYQWQNPLPKVVQWSTPKDLQNGFVSPADYAKPDIICHLEATPADLAVPVNGGDEVAIHWDTWPESHKGPINDALAKCDGPCQSADKTKLKFFVIGRVALLNAASDFWAPNQLIKNDLTWFIKIPESIEPGNYVLRHEIIGLHAAGQTNGAQNYPFCFNLAISSTGKDKPAGIPATQFYKANSPGIVFDLFSKHDSYPIPGPELYSGALNATQRKPPAGAKTGTPVTTLDVAALPTAA